MLTFTTEELDQIMLGLCMQYDALCHCVKVTQDLPEVCDHWKNKIISLQGAYDKVQVQYLKQSAEDLRKSLESA